MKNSNIIDLKKERLKLYIELANKLNGDFAEVGVFKGESAEVLAHFKSHNKKLFLFDTFEGLPKVSIHDSMYKKGDFASSIKEIKEKLKLYNDVVIYKGYFPRQNFNFVKDKTFSLVHLDVKLYKSYRDCLSFFYPRMVKGGIIVFNDYLSIKSKGCYIAVTEFLKNKPENTLWFSKPQACIIKQNNIKKKSTKKK